MAFNAYINFEQEKIDKLPWVRGSWSYLFKGPVGKTQGEVYRGILFEVDNVNYDKLTDRLKGQSQESIKSGDKVYQMPGSKIPLFKLKDHLKKVGAVHVSDVNQATFFIGTDKCEENLQGRRLIQGGNSSLLFRQETTQIVLDIVKAESHWDNVKSTDSWESIKDFGKYKDIYVSKELDHDGINIPNPPNEPDYEDYDKGKHDPDYKKDVITYNEELAEYNLDPPKIWIAMKGQKYFMTPVAAMIIYNSISKKLPIVSEDVILTQIAPVTVIDEDNFESLHAMINSDDDENVAIGAEVLANCDIDKSLFYLWKLSQDYGGRNVNSVNIKNVRLFRDRSNWYNLINMNAECFIEYMKEKKLLTPDYFDKIIQQASEQYMTTLNNSVFKMILVPSEKFKDYSQEKHKFEFNFKSDD